MSGPATTSDDTPETVGAPTSGPAVDVTPSRMAEVEGLPVARALPLHGRRTIGAWCFADHFGPTDVATAAMQIGPHPHIGLQTVTWLIEGELLHRDSLGSEQLIRPGQLNLMTAGRGVAHAEETPATTRGAMHGVQLWVAQPGSTRDGGAAFEHHAALPQATFGGVEATVLLGQLGDARSPARTDSPLVGAELRLGGRSVVPLDASFEHGLIVTMGTVEIDGTTVQAGTLAYLGVGRAELAISGAPTSRALLVGGQPFPEDVRMWWNFVARSNAELEEAFTAWERADSERFPAVASPLAPIDAPRPYWMRPTT